MRFSETLRFNANPEWWVYYIPYDDLKTHISHILALQNSLFFLQHSPQNSLRVSSNSQTLSHPPSDDSSDDEIQQDRHRSPSTTPHMSRSASRKVLAELDAAHPPLGYGGALGGKFRQQRIISDAHLSEAMSELEAREKLNVEEQLFFDKLNASAERVDNFFNMISREMATILQEVKADAQALLARFNPITGTSEVRPLLADVEQGSVMLADRDVQAFRRKVVELYKELGETVNFSTLNRNGFDKILKKHDKSLRKVTRVAFMENLVNTTSFTDTSNLLEMQAELERVFADVAKEGDQLKAKNELKNCLRDLIVWDRNTIWRDLLRTERKISHVRPMQGGQDVDISRANDAVFAPKLLPLAFALTTFVIILLFPGLVEALAVPASDGSAIYSPATLHAAHRCLALTAFVIVLWAFDGLPLYVTSLIVLPSVVLLRVFLDDDGTPLKPSAAANLVFKSLGSSTILLIICVYSLGAALSKFEIDKELAVGILSRVHRADRLVLVLMFLSVFVSMFVSNVAAPVLLNSVMMPTISAMSNLESERSFVRCILLGIMIGSNIGGFASPISSPQSAVALGLLVGEDRISFMKWLFAALPLCGIMVAMCYVVLYWKFKPGRFRLPPLPRSTEKFGWPHWVVMMTLSVTVMLWAFHSLSENFGSPGIVAVIPVIIFFGTGILNKEDFNTLPWDVVYLVAGGVVLGAAVESCKLLDLVAGNLNAHIAGRNLYMTYVIFCSFMALIANAVSHTVSAIIVLPLIMKVGVAIGHAQLLVLGGTFAASAAMGLPISSFPNISATQVEDEKGQPFLTPTDITRIGLPMTGVAVAALLTFGYVLMTSLGM